MKRQLYSSGMISFCGEAMNWTKVPYAVEAYDSVEALP
jgi:hypothetical protein